MPHEAVKVISKTYVVFTRFCEISFTCKQFMAILVYGKLNTRKLNTENSTHSKKEENSTQKLNKLQHIQLILVNP